MFTFVRISFNGSFGFANDCVAECFADFGAERIVVCGCDSFDSVVVFVPACCVECAVVRVVVSADEHDECADVYDDVCTHDSFGFAVECVRVCSVGLVDVRMDACVVEDVAVSENIARSCDVRRCMPCCRYCCDEYCRCVAYKCVVYGCADRSIVARRCVYRIVCCFACRCVSGCSLMYNFSISCSHGCSHCLLHSIDFLYSLAHI